VIICIILWEKFIWTSRIFSWCITNFIWGHISIKKYL